MEGGGGGKVILKEQLGLLDLAKSEGAFAPSAPLVPSALILDRPSDDLGGGGANL